MWYIPSLRTWPYVLSGDNYLETYAPLVNMLSIRLLLSIAKIYNLEPKVIDFILASPQEDLENRANF